jgi:hypothetical protein
MKLLITSILIVGGFMAVVPFVVLRDALMIQIGLGDYTLFTRLILLAGGGAIALFIGWQLWKSGE